MFATFSFPEYTLTALGHPVTNGQPERFVPQIATKTIINQLGLLDNKLMSHRIAPQGKHRVNY